MHIKKTERCARVTAFLGVLIVVGLFAIRTSAQSNAQERGANLRAQLVEVQAKQAELQARLGQLEEDLKSENIERSLAGVGSVHPEELREARRRKLEIEKKGVQSQLDLLAASRARLEAALARADAESYQQSAAIDPNANKIQSNSATPNASSKAKPTRQHQLKKRKSSRRS
jgi:hypothetical protein